MQVESDVGLDLTFWRELSQTQVGRELKSESHESRKYQTRHFTRRLTHTHTLSATRSLNSACRKSTVTALNSNDFTGFHCNVLNLFFKNDLDNWQFE